MVISVQSCWSLLKTVLSTAKILASPAEKIFFRRAYEISSLAKCHREVLGRFPHGLTDDLEYDFHLGEYYLREEIFCPLFWIKSRSGKHYSKVELVINALGAYQQFQCSLTLHDLSTLPIRTTLPGIPLRVLKKNIRIENGSLYMPYEKVEVKVVGLWDNDGQRMRVSSCCVSLYPVDRLEIAMGEERGDVEKWGMPYNFEFLESEIREERIRLIAPYVMGRRLCDRINGEVFGWKWIARASFWRKNLISASHLSKRYAEFEKWHQGIDEYRKRN